MKKTGISAIAAIAGIASALAGDVAWTGAAGDGLWKSTGNWDGNALPGATGAAVFNLSNPATVSLDTTQKELIGLTVSNGSLCLTSDGASGAFNCSSVTTEVFVASGATLVSSNNWFDSAQYSKTLLVRGAGKAIFKGTIGQASSAKYFKAVVFRE